MKKWRRESVLDLYNLLLAMFLFVSPWLFLSASGKATMDLRASSTAIAVISLAAMTAFSYWEEWANLLLGIWLLLSPWVLASPIRAQCISVSALAPRWPSSPRSICGWYMRTP